MAGRDRSRSTGGGSQASLTPDLFRHEARVLPDLFRHAARVLRPEADDIGLPTLDAFRRRESARILEGARRRLGVG